MLLLAANLVCTNSKQGCCSPIALLEIHFFPNLPTHLATNHRSITYAGRVLRCVQQMPSKGQDPLTRKSPT